MHKLRTLDAGLARFETAIAAVAIAAVLIITSAGAVLRSLGSPLLWADEAAISAMIWAALFGASALLARRGHMGIEMLNERLGPQGRLVLQLLSDVVVLLAAMGLAWLVWRWFDLPGLIRTGSGQALADQTFNFIYLEPTQTLGISKIWIWLALPLFTLGALFHAAVLLADDIATLIRPTPPPTVPPTATETPK